MSELVSTINLLIYTNYQILNKGFEQEINV